ncbi:MAG: hypothetical protein ILA52_01725, partial [Alphaproteobacteria bacterium]|nr:hypothetical protein [Alphaproteobacteria bacterium]
MRKCKLIYLILRPRFAEDTPSIFGRCVQMGYASEKIASRFTQTGRSMIEMLGVLAIIGVLSVGGIAGFQKAMITYRINTVINDHNMLIANIRDLFSSKPNFSELYDISEKDRIALLSKAKVLPEKFTICPNADAQICHKYLYRRSYGGGTSVRVEAWDKNVLTIVHWGIEPEYCIALATHDWSDYVDADMTLSVNTDGCYTPKSCTSKL